MSKITTLSDEIIDIKDYKFTPLNPENIKTSLEVMWKGMLAIFIVIAIVILVTLLTNFIIVEFEAKKKLKKQDGGNSGSNDNF